MATVSVVRYQRKKKIGDDKSPMVYVLKPKPGESKLYSIESLAREIESDRFAFGGGCGARDAILCPFDEEGARSGE